jgi:L-fuconolactonase
MMVKSPSSSAIDQGSCASRKANRYQHVIGHDAVRDEMAKVPTVDSHVHVWHPGWRDYPWMAGLDRLQQPHLPEDLAPLLAGQHIDYAVLVQTVSDVQETREFLQIAEANAFIAGVVGWVDLVDPDIDATIRALKDRPDGHYLVGIRHQVHDERDPAYLGRGAVQRGISAIGAAGLAYDLLLKPPFIDAAVTCTAALPEVRFVIDHIAKPDIANNGFDWWARKMVPFADMPHVSCKLSGLVTEADWNRWTVEELKPYVHKVMEWFGEDRVMFGSDWPVCTLAASYEQVVNALREALGPISSETDAKIFGVNAVRTYRLPIPEAGDYPRS